MSAMSNYLENEILDHILGTGSYTSPANVYIGLANASFGDTGTDTTEISGSGYARVAVTFNAAASGTADNNAVVEFSAATGDWGTVTHFGLYDASTAGNLLIHGAFTTGKHIQNGDILRIAAGDLDVSAD